MLTRRRFLVGSGFATFCAAVLARRLLMAGGGGGSFSLPPGVLELAAAPAGGWSWFMDPRAVAVGAYTYLGYNVAGTVGIAVITGGAVVATRTLHAALEYDDHDVPTFAVRTDGRLITFYSKHLGANIYRRVSVNTLASDPTISGGFGSETSLSAGFGAALSTYPSPLALSNSDGVGPAMFLFWREHVAGIAYWWYGGSTTDGASWAGPASLHSLTYSKVCTDGVGRVDVAITEAPGGGTNEGKVWHLYREAAAWHHTDGSSMSGSMPFGPSQLTEVFDGTGAGDLVWISDVALTPAGDPVIVFVRYAAGDQDDHRAMYAAWNGASWDVNEICVMGNPGGISAPYGGSSYATYHAGLALDHADPQIVYVGRWVSGQVEMFRYTTADAGASFTPEQLTTGSAAKNIRPVAVRGAGEIAVVWLYGAYTTYVDYSLGLRGLAP